MQTKVEIKLLEACREALNWMISYQTEHPGKLHARAIKKLQDAIKFANQA